ncbi:hypothetical protein BDW75DRAFT_223884, partial [Aspergillus navahoensis]
DLMFPNQLQQTLVICLLHQSIILAISRLLIEVGKTSRPISRDTFISCTRYKQSTPSHRIALDPHRNSPQIRRSSGVGSSRSRNWWRLSLLTWAKQWHPKQPQYLYKAQVARWTTSLVGTLHCDCCW